MKKGVSTMPNSFNEFENMTTDEIIDSINALRERAIVTSRKIEIESRKGNTSEEEGLRSLAAAIENGIKNGERVLSERGTNSRGGTSGGFDPMKSYGFRSVATFESATFGNSSRDGVVNENELRAFQKFITTGAKGLSAEESRALSTSGAAAVIPTDIFNGLITDSKYSDLLSRAHVFNDGTPGKLYIPIASSTSASWHTENAPETEAEPNLSKLDLGGYELMRLMKISAATEALSVTGFAMNMQQLLSSEVIETLEYSFVNGTGSGQPKGLVNLNWVSSGEGQNAVITESSAEITYKDIAAGLALLPQKYARNAVLLMNAYTAYNTLAAADDTGGSPVFSIGDGTNTVLGKEIVITEHCPANNVFVVDPHELYVRFAAPMKVEADRSSGFTSASINIRALAVVDAAWNPAAAVKVAKAA